MSKILKKIVAVVMVVIMVAAYVPMVDTDTFFSVRVSALVSKNNSMSGSNAKWTYDTSNRTLTISGSGAMPNYSKTPDAFAKYNARLIVTIKNHARNIVVNSGITSIGNYTFADFANITSVSIPATVTSVGEGAFKNCSSLTSVTVPASVTSVGRSAFEGCSKLATVNLNTGLKTIGAYAFKNTKFASVSLPYTVTSVGEHAFAGISGINVTCAYGDAAYKYCTNSNHITAYKLKAPALEVKTDFNVKTKKIVVTLVLNNAAGLNAANFELTHGNGAVLETANIIPGEVMDKAVNIAVVKNSASKISIAVTAKECVPFTAGKQTISLELAKLTFKINEKADTADFSLKSKVMMLDNKKVSATEGKTSVSLHNYVEDTAKFVAATCKTQGTRVYKCTICSKTKTEKIAIDTTKHTGKTVVKNAVKATCTVKGYTGDKVCSLCSKVVEKGQEIPAAHTGSVVTKNAVAATCTTNGYTGDKVCSACGTVFENGTEIPAAHTGEIVIKNAVNAASCTEKGYSGDKVCSACGGVIEIGMEVYGAHSGATELKNVVAATYTEPGYTGDKVCADCGEVVEAGSEIPVLNHEHDFVVVESDEGDCLSIGYTKYECSSCEETKVESAGDFGGHKYETTVITEATCTSAGEQINECSVCGNSYREIVKAKGHSFVDETVEASCVASGYVVHTCSVCASSYMSDITQGLGHEYDKDGKCIRCGDVHITEIVFVQNNFYEIKNSTINAGDSDSSDAEGSEIKLITSKSALITVADFLANIEGDGWVIKNSAGEVVENDALITTDCTVSHESNSDAEYKVVICGDVNTDGKVTAADARLVLRTAASLEKLTDIKNVAADVDANEKVVASDARKILRVSSRIDEFK